MTKLSLASILVPLGLACSTAEASRELQPSSLGTAVASLVAATSTTVDSSAPTDAPAPHAPEADIDMVYPGLRRAYSPADMRLHDCARLDDDGSIVGRDCPAGIIVSGPRVVAPTHSDVRVRFQVESASDIEVTSDIVSDDARQVHGRLEAQSLAAGEKRTFGYGVHVFEAAARVEARIAVRGPMGVDLRMSGVALEVE